MASSDTGQSQIRYARLAGFMYLFVTAVDLLGMFITGRFRVPGNFAETAHRVMGAELLYRAGLSAELIGSLCTVFLAMGLYGAVKPLNNNLALLALVFRLAEATLGGAQSILGFAVLKLYVGAGSMKAFDANQLSVLANLPSGLWNISAIFFGIGSILFFYLFLRSTYIPKVLSVLGLFASVLVPVICFAPLLLPQPPPALQFGWIPMLVAEISMGLWLLFKGVNVRQGA